MYSTEVIEALPQKPLSNFDIIKCANKLKLPYFRGVFMKDTLPQKIYENESAIVNLDSIKGEGTHWVSYFKKGLNIEYFDSFGNLKPPVELQCYFFSTNQPVTIHYNYFPKQKENTINCGHLCLDFLAVRKNDLHYRK